MANRNSVMTKKTTEAGGRSPLSGCAILVTAFCVVIFLLVFSTWTLFRQFEEIAKFTTDKQSLVVVESLDGREAAINGLSRKVEEFRQALAGEGPASLGLSVDEVNLAIALWEPFKDLRGTFRVESASDGVLRIAISFPLNGRPRMARDGEAGWVVADPRYLEAVMVAEPAVSQREVVLRIRELEVPGKQVPREFIEQMSPYRITERYVNDGQIGPAMAKLTKAEVRDDTLWLEHVPGESAQGVIGREQVDASRNRLFTWLGVAASLFLMVAGAIVFMGLRRSARRKS